ncbi:tripartite tricarboxylate transporter TctB family protein [Pseudomonas sp. v388]|uniref:tripartite tricarboxylate transporter TctB family protein n=1 Tax=Pseudomonas sp. v388 TaxID=2479849 RepID=UPI000F798056|nr:tripartite tricarboxylate transporter TctB family protein [Pseudomonas sp. v388]RRV10204.1 tripartite tricarboxylate transporter TctB family protein [Pseudomonas sp. v388]
MSAPRQQIDFTVGLLYLLLGAAFAWGAYGYGLGTPAGMGAGFFPFWLGIGLGGLGVGAIVRAWARHRPAQHLERWAWKPLCWVLGALGLFAFLLPHAGLVIASIVLVLVSSQASDQFSWRGSVSSAAVISVFCALVFVVGLGLPMPLWPTFFG